MEAVVSALVGLVGVLVGGIVTFCLITILLVMKGSVLDLPITDEQGYRWHLILQYVLLITAGIHLLLLTCYDLYRRRDSGAVLVFCWIFGTFAFSTFFNWTTNGRTMLPMIPALGLLVVRQYEWHRKSLPGERQPHLSLLLKPLVLVALACGALLALATTWADYTLANTQRHAAREITGDLKKFNSNIYFLGHWGFQYYMELFGTTAVDFNDPQDSSGDLTVIPNNNTNMQKPPHHYQLIKKYTFPASHWLTTMQPPPIGAGFYASVWGPIPFYFGSVPEEKYQVLKTLY